MRLEYMWESIRNGLFSRGGIAYGDIVEPDKVNNSIGRFVLGRPQRRQLKWKGRAKGAESSVM